MKHTPQPTQPELPFVKLCECGCGQPVSNPNNRFIHNHHHRGSRNVNYRPLLERFWEKVDKRGPDDCWLWTGSNNGKGYGLIGIHGRSVRAHRFSYELHYGPIPDGFEVRHKCDNPPCCNWAHLVLGTHQDNMDDMYGKDRRKPAKGAQSNKSTITEDQARAIRQRRTNGETGVALAKEYGVTTAAICAIFKRKNWPHVV